MLEFGCTTLLRVWVRKWKQSSPYSPDVDGKGNRISDPRCYIEYLSYRYVLNLKFSWYVSSLNLKPRFMEHINFGNVAFSPWTSDKRVGNKYLKALQTYFFKKKRIADLQWCIPFADKCALGDDDHSNMSWSHLLLEKMRPVHDPRECIFPS